MSSQSHLNDPDNSLTKVKSVESPELKVPDPCATSNFVVAPPVVLSNLTDLDRTSQPARTSISEHSPKSGQSLPPGNAKPEGIRSRWTGANTSNQLEKVAEPKPKGKFGRIFFITVLLIGAPLLAVFSAISCDPRFAGAMHNPKQRGVLCRVAGHLIQPSIPAGARWFYEQSYVADPSDTTGLVDLALMKQVAGDEVGAKADYERLLKISPNARIYNNLANIYESERRYPDAIAAYTESLRLNPDWAFASYNRGNIYARQGRYDEALADYKRSIKSHYATAYFRRAELYKSLGRNDLASRDLRIIHSHGYTDTMFGFMKQAPPADEE